MTDPKPKPPARTSPWIILVWLIIFWPIAIYILWKEN